MDFLDDAFFDKIFSLFGVGLGATIIITIIGSLITFAGFVAVIVLIIKSCKKNKNSPCLTVPAEIVSKRTEFSQHRRTTTTNANGFHEYDSDLHTWHYATFQVESGDRMEFCIPVYEYGMLIEGDRGKLTFQGTRYISFERF